MRLAASWFLEPNQSGVLPKQDAAMLVHTGPVNFTVIRDPSSGQYYDNP